MSEAVERTSRSYGHGQNYSNGQLNFTCINMTNYYSQEQYIFITSPPPSRRANVLVPFIFPTMVELLQLMYQGSNMSSFETHPKKMYLAVASFLIYCFSYDAQLRLITQPNNYSNYAKMVGSIFGPLTLASYSSVLFPSLCPILYTISTLYSATSLLNRTLLTERFNWLYQKFISARFTDSSLLKDLQRKEKEAAEY